MLHASLVQLGMQRSSGVYGVACLLLLVVAAPPGRGVAQQPASPAATYSDAQKKDARELFSHGVEASESGKPEAAIAYFERSFAAYPAPNTAVNIAGLYLELENYDAVITWAERAKALPDIQVSTREIADSYIDQARPYATNAADEETTAPDPAPSALDQALLSEPAAEEDSSTAITEQWWFWAGVGVLAVGATVGVIVVTGGGEEDPVNGNLMPGVVTWN